VEETVITFRLDPSSGVPPYLQLVQQVEHAVRSGRLHGGDQLPMVREVVGALSINPNTVLKAYRQLDALGLTEGRPGVGTFVRDVPAGMSVPAYPALRRRLVAWVDAARREGLEDAELKALFADALHSAEQRGIA
jgi:GntR family transcriptional regulator